MEGSGVTEELKVSDTTNEGGLETAEKSEVLKVEIDDKEKVAEAEEFKKEGNTFFAACKYQDSYDAYSKAVDLQVGGKKQ
jgi:TusA-related sulfurtransferase